MHCSLQKNQAIHTLVEVVLLARRRALVRLGGLLALRLLLGELGGETRKLIHFESVMKS